MWVTQWRASLMQLENDLVKTLYMAKLSIHQLLQVQFVAEFTVHQIQFSKKFGSLGQNIKILTVTTHQSQNDWQYQFHYGS